MKKIDKLTKSVEEVWQIPKDILTNAPVIRMYGKYDLIIENFKCILEYTGELIRLQCYDCCVCIKGKKLRIQFYCCHEMLIKGCIEQVIII